MLLAGARAVAVAVAVVLAVMGLILLHRVWTASAPASDPRLEQPPVARAGAGVGR
jgi:hypothetical protein